MDLISRRRRVAIVIAAFDEAPNVEKLCPRLSRVFADLSGTSSIVIWVIEGKLGTAEVVRAESLSRNSPEFEIILPDRPRGLGAAVRLGLARVPKDTDFVITMDADLSHQPEEIPRMLDLIESEGADIVVGSRKVRGGSVSGLPLWQIFSSKLVSWGIRLLFRTGIRDITSGFRVYNAQALEVIHFQSDGYAYLPEVLGLALRAQLHVVETPIQYVYRSQAESKLRVIPVAKSYIRFVLTYLGLL